MRQKLGQHFLKDKKILRSIVKSASIGGGDTVIEVGPGHGELTEEFLRPWVGTLRLVAVEKDPELSAILKEKYKDDKRVEIIEGDVRKILPQVIEKQGLKTGGYRLVGNIPYYLTGYLFRIIASLPQKPKVCVFTIQKEVALRMVAEPPHMNLLAASILHWGEPKIEGFVGKTSFSPPPKVDSAIIKITPHINTDQENTMRDEDYYHLIKILFAQPRKTILNNLCSAPEGVKMEKGELEKKLKTFDIDPAWRPQNLDVSLIKKIGKIVYNNTDE